MNKTRVLRLISRMNVGGPAIQISGLMTKLSTNEFEQRLVTGFCDTDEIDFLELNNSTIPVKRIEGFGRRINFLSDLNTFFAIRKEILTFSPHIIHTHTAKAGLLGRLASLSTFKRHIRVHTFHGHLLHDYFGFLKTKLVIFIERVLALFTKRLIAVGIQVMDDLIEARIGNRKKYNVIGPGLEIGNLTDRSWALSYFGLEDNLFTITWIGRVAHIKAPYRVLEVAEECLNRNLDVQIVIVGDGDLMSYLKDEAKRKKLPVVFLGWQSEIEKILSFSDLVILTSKNEGTPVSLIQAQMAGVPVLTTDVGSASEVLIDGRSGFCLKYSASLFADKIQFFASSSSAKSQFGSFGKAYTSQKFSLKRLVDDHADLYRYLVNQSTF